MANVDGENRLSWDNIYDVRVCFNFTDRRDKWISNFSSHCDDIEYHLAGSINRIFSIAHWGCTGMIGFSGNFNGKPSLTYNTVNNCDWNFFSLQDTSLFNMQLNKCL